MWKEYGAAIIIGTTIFFWVARWLMQPSSKPRTPEQTQALVQAFEHNKYLGGLQGYMLKTTEGYVKVPIDQVLEIEATVDRVRDATSLLVRTPDATTILAHYDPKEDATGDGLKPGDAVVVTGRLNHPFGGYNLELRNCHFARKSSTSPIEVIRLVR